MASKLVRLLAVLMVLVVPVQGAASVASGVCMALGHHQELGHEHGAQAHNDHDHGAHAHESAAEETSDDAKANHCGPCAACCASASIAGPVSYSIAASSSEAPYILAQLPPTPVQAGGVYRPPLAR